MRRHPVRLLILVLLAAAVIRVAVTLPSAPATGQAPAGFDHTQSLLVRGAVHIHTNRSDGTGTPEEIAAAAARAGLQFIVFADHGDGTRGLERPVYHSGVLCLDGVEISTTGGHYLAMGLARPPYPLGGDPRDVVEDVRRLGGFGIAAHPDSQKDEQQWRDLTLPVDALEWMNGDSQWRDESWPQLLEAIVHYAVRPAAAIGSVLDAPQTSLHRWDAVAATRRVLALAGADAHARLGMRGDPEPTPGRLLVRLPAYEQIFRAMTVRAEVGTALSGNAEEDATRLVTAFREGRIYSVVDALSEPGWFEFTATQSGRLARMGDTLPAGAPIVWRARVAAPEGTAIVLLHNGTIVKREVGRELAHESAGAPGSWRVEVHTPGAPGVPPIPFIVGNPIFVRDAPVAPAAPAGRPALETFSLYADGDATGWRVEHQAESRAALDVLRSTTGRELALRYALNSNRAVLPFAAAVVPVVDRIGGYDRLLVRVRADRAVRLSIQLRAAGGAPNHPRWRRSVPLDAEMRELEVAFDTFLPVPPEERAAPDLAAVDALLFVIDTVNTAPGTAGIVWLDDVRLARPAARPGTRPRD